MLVNKLSLANMEKKRGGGGIARKLKCQQQHARIVYVFNCIRSNRKTKRSKVEMENDVEQQQHKYMNTK